MPASRREVPRAGGSRAGNTPAGNFPTADFSQRLYRETEGLPFFITEYLATLRGDITPGETTPSDPSGSLTTWNGDEAWPVPHGVRDLLRSRMEQIGETGVQLLQAAAVIGRSFDFDTLHEVSGRTDEETVITLEKLIARGLIRESQPGNGGSTQDTLRSLNYDFSHEKLRSFVYNETSLARRRLLHVRTAEALVTHARGRYELPSQAGSIASHYKQGGGLGRRRSTTAWPERMLAAFTPTAKRWLIFNRRSPWGIRMCLV